MHTQDVGRLTPEVLQWIQENWGKFDKKAQAFLYSLASLSSVTAACEAAGITRQAMYQRRATDEDFAKAWDEAAESGIDRVEDVAFRSALNGNVKLVQFILKNKRPDIYQRGDEPSVPVEVKATIELVASKNQDT